MINPGDVLPDATLFESTQFGDACPMPPAKISAKEAAAGKKIVIFGLPGAYTPTCSAKHVPSFVMAQWGKDQDALGKIRFLGDGQGELAKKLGLDVEIPGMGLRMRRSALIVDDGVVKDVKVEEGGKFEVSSAESVLSRL